MIGVLVAAWLDVRSKPLRTLIALSGMVAAITAVMVIGAASILSHQANEIFIASTYGRTATLSIASAGDLSGGSAGAERSAAQLQTLLQANGVHRVSMHVDIATVLVINNSPIRTNAIWVSSNYPEVSIVDIVAGQFPTDTAQSDTLHAVISLDLARRLGFSGPDAVGSVINYIATENVNIDLRTTVSQPLIIDAVAESSNVAFGGAGILLVSDLDRPDLLGEFFSRSWLVHVNPADAGMVRGLAESVTTGNSGRAAFMVTRVDQGDELAPVLAQQETTARGVTTVALLVGGLGILGIGLASVRERGRDFGLRRALGASKQKIFLGVLAQSLLEALLSAAIAIPLAVLIVNVFARRLVLETLPLPPSPSLPVDSALRGIIAAMAVGLIAGLAPAFRAARASVVQALRD